MNKPLDVYRSILPYQVYATATDQSPTPERQTGPTADKDKVSGFYVGRYE